MAFGSVYRLPGNRRKPWTARITVGHVEAHYSYRYLGYYRTQAEALLALAEYNRDPYDTSGITFGEVFKRFMEEKRPKVAESTYRNYNTVFNATEELHSRQMVQLNLDALQRFVDTCGRSYISLKRIKAALVTVFEYALKHDYVRKNYAAMIDVEKMRNGYQTREKAVFTPDEIRTLWSMADDNDVAEMLVFMLYTGIRISEMLALKMEDVDLDLRGFRVLKSKTEAGVRTVPIADCIMPMVQRKAGSEYFFANRVSQTHLQSIVLPRLMKSLGMEHTFHETRHTFITMLTEAGVDERIIRTIVGHAGESLTEKVYTHISIQPLLDAVNKLPVYKD